jgi:hypothetical protein
MNMISNRRNRLLTKIINAITFAVLYSTVGIVGHAAAMPSGVHHGVEHSSSAANCATVCLSAPTSVTKRETPIYDEKDNEPSPPYYLQFASTHTGWYAEKSITPRVLDQEDKIPIYQRCCVLRV